MLRDKLICDVFLLSAVGVAGEMNLLLAIIIPSLLYFLVSFLTGKFYGINHTVRHFILTAIKNDTERKFCYQQLPVTLKLIYTILQVQLLI